MPRQKGIQRKDQITNVATNKFREKGYRAVSMRELADHVGIEAASFYNHFDSKESILKEICFRMAHEFFNGLEEAMKAQQNNQCAICFEAFKSTKDTHVDHDHETKKVRGLLCGNCNHLLGKAHDHVEVLERAIVYLRWYKTC
jgi:AcrR family transcriptional regulator